METANVTLSVNDEDIWDLDEEENMWDLDDDSSDCTELKREWEYRQTQFTALGYRDGIEAGEKSSVQEGFEAGFSEAKNAGYEWGQARGWTIALMTLPETVKKILIDDATQMQVISLQTTVSLISSDEAPGIFHHSLIGETTTDDDDAESLGVVSTGNQMKKIHSEVLSTLRSAGVPLL